MPVTRTSVARSRPSPRESGTGEPSRAAGACPRRRRGGGPSSGPGWLEWLRARLDPAWRPGEWDGGALLFTGDLAVAADRGVAVPDTGVPDGDAPPVGTLRRLPAGPGAAGTGWDEFDAAPPPRATGRCGPGRCTVPGCEGDLHCSGLVLPARAQLGQEPQRTRRGVHRPGPAAAAGRGCRVAGCDRESVTRRGLCRFHDQRLHARTPPTLSGEQLAAWIAGERPRLGVHQFSLAGLPELLQAELLFALQRRDQAPPPLDPTEIRILLARLDGAASLREADPQARLRVRRDAVQHGNPRAVP